MYRIKTAHRKLLADTCTPVSLYLKLRDRFPGSMLLESSDYRGSENSYSYICCMPAARFCVENGTITETFPGGTHSEKSDKEVKVTEALSQFAAKFDGEKNDFGFLTGGLFGYISYDAVRYFDNVELQKANESLRRLPDVLYHVYQCVLVFDHFREELHIFSHSFGEEANTALLDEMEGLIANRNFASYKFRSHGGELSDCTDEDFLALVAKAKGHCHRGDVFQLVLSREFMQAFSGDEFNVYRALRSVNPSPYLFYFDYGNFKIFGSSPEAQIVVRNSKATIYPIAGTFKRTDSDAADAELALRLQNDEKENAEHVMLVDLARNDLSRNCSGVEVEVFREVQYYSHVIHLVSKVSGTLGNGVNGISAAASAFPAGTLTGAPKHRAIQLIDRYEKTGRGFYGGCIGAMGFNGDFNHAIMIRSFMSINGSLHYRAGAGIVAASDDRSELEEVNNKLMALKKAIKLAETF
jgi:anthranilate synthase component I